MKFLTGIRNVFLKMIMILLITAVYLPVCLISLIYSFLGYIFHASVIVLTIGVFLMVYVRYQQSIISHAIVYAILGACFVILDVIIIPDCIKIEQYLKSFLAYIIKAKPRDVYLYIDWKFHPKKYRKTEKKQNKKEETFHDQNDTSNQTHTSTQDEFQSGPEKEGDYSLFAGIKTKEDAKNRYRSLMKIYHPDMQNGDTTMSLKVQEEYERIMKTL